MDRLVVEVILSIFTFGLGFFSNHWWQAKAAKEEKVKQIDNSLAQFMDKVEGNKKTYILKYDYNRLKHSVEQFCRDYHVDINYFTDDLINLNIFSTYSRNLNKVSEISISIINRIRAI